MALEPDQEFELMSRICDLENQLESLQKNIVQFLPSLHSFMRTARVTDPEGAKKIDYDICYHFSGGMSKHYKSKKPDKEVRLAMADAVRLVTTRSNNLESKWLASGQTSNPAFKDALALAVDLETNLVAKSVDNSLLRAEMQTLQHPVNQ